MSKGSPFHTSRAIFRSMRGDLGRQGKTSTQHKNQSFEDYDGCVDEVNDVGVHFPAACSSKPIAKESDSLYSNLSSKSAKLLTHQQQQQQLQRHSHSLLPDFGNLSAFECPNQESDFLQCFQDGPPQY
ncbi:hypothetical protein RIF29_06862 [Crotalaria pallida]|uniref:Uncharacterized protein n=1 Tax=Crotalaria pallida TaxID=3830 RepID=A0AAN9J6A9_CROPI